MMRDHYFELGPFLEEFQRGGAALLFHRIGRTGLLTRRRGLTLPPGVFSRQMAELNSAGFQSTISPDEIRTRKRIFITFDDGDSTTLAALEPLRTNGFRALQFLVASRIGGKNDWDNTGAPLMDDAQVRDWLAAGHAIGSHTLTHSRLRTMQPEDARTEISASKHKLEDRFGVAVEFFAYPWGESDSRLEEEVALAGYRAAFTTRQGVNDEATPPFALRRHTVWCALRNPRELWFALTA